MPNIQDIILHSDLAGLAQIEEKTFSVSIPSVSWASGAGATFFASTSMPNTSAIPDVQVKLTGLSSKWFWLSPFASFSYPEGTNAGNSDMEVSMTAYFTNDTVYVRIFTVNNAFTTTTRPAFTVDCKVFLDEAPF